MKKTMEQQLEEIIAVTEEQQGLKGLPKELKEVKQQIKNLLTVIKNNYGNGDNFYCSIAAGAVYAKITDTEFTLLTSGMSGWIFVLILTILSHIFDYGCKLQQESDETL